MKRDEIIALLRSREPELRAEGVLSISLFGSVARGENRQDSDVDVVVRLSKTFSDGGFDYFGRMADLAGRLARTLECKVDVVEEPVRKQRLQRQIDEDRILVF